MTPLTTPILIFTWHGSEAVSRLRLRRHRQWEPAFLFKSACRQSNLKVYVAWARQNMLMDADRVQAAKTA